ncbi:acetyl-CoA acetyltransferase [Rhodococcus sp. 05-2256-B2]|uniref:acetyl-CoA C-acyltransferase n=1 Tax=Nocardiaceae TaxID=85025 RepID=UPI00050CED3C|nr:MULTISPECIES: acetyl-CoA C-acyltransferase [Rhodococcus]OZD87639.1 acetyl-CoA acetyltransferase [Rhodococcus sp. 05-2256-B4]OZD89904.1 acetyl-CoA acetyltransferase [Rhodococcus sp. 05-2256-B2]OZD92222.1 acetyl-CoA acetyltransferase [Rhodococcus sp. 05-2256-B3]OZD98927.1 acetyl-CoA acetyltransferase [Rhodococcus sp. 05-2256-B1]
MSEHTRPAVYIVDAVRTPTGRRGGGASAIHPVDLAAHTLRALIERTGIDPAAVDDVIMGCVGQIGGQAWNTGRNAWLSAGLPEEVPAVTIDRQCGSSQQAVAFAAQGIRAGDYDLVVAAGVESMSTVPLNSSGTVGPDLNMRYPFDGAGWQARFGEQEIHQFRGGDLIVEQWGITDDEMVSLAERSHRNASRAWDEGRFDAEVAPLGELTVDEGFRRTLDTEKMRGLAPIRAGGRHTAALASQLADGSSAILLASESAVRQHGLAPLARVHSNAVVGSDPVLILSGPIPATRRVLKRAGLEIDDIDLFECNEAFAGVVAAWSKDTGAPIEKTNVNGGAMALGHPLGASGAKLMTTLVHELRRSGGRWGLQTMCEGGGLANATIIENLDK